MKQFKCNVIVALLLLPFAGFTQTIIPAPQSVTKAAHSFDEAKISQLRFIYSSDETLEDEINVFDEMINQLGYKAPEHKISKYDVIHLQIDTHMSGSQYTIQNKENNSIELRGTEDGVFYGLMSLLQLIHQSQTNSNLTISNIADYPAYDWRGMHLDCCRHFFSKEFVKKYIDLIALHKMNVFHWHLTDDQGWRIEIKKYPLLTKIGSKRKETMTDKNFDPYIGDGKPVEGFYSQEDIKEIVRYAKSRHITIVPEIEMPGHAQAALSAYPEYSCRKQALEPLTKWGVSDDVFCTSEATIRFVEDVLDEVMTLFPSSYIHIGGDEVPKIRWKACQVCQKNMKMNSLKNEDELQSYFIKRIDAYVTSKGRNIIGWDEILDGGLAPNAAVMSWRGEDGGIAAARQKHKVVMTPGTHCYFDHYQGNKNTEPLSIGGFTPIEKVYAYQPAPAVLSAEQKKYILGAQANIWTEYIATTDHVEYMALPRMSALAEVLWTGDKRPGFDDFKNRLRTHFTFLDKLNVHYATSIFDVTANSNIVNDHVEVKLQSAYTKSGSSIRYYFLDEKAYLDIKKYSDDQPIILTKSSKMKAQYFENDVALGHALTEEYLIHKALNKQITSDIEPSKYYHEGGLPKLLDARAGHAPRISSDWLGWSGQNPVLIIDLGKSQDLSNLNIYTLKEEMNWIYLPSKIEVSWSSDGTNYEDGRPMNAESIMKAYTGNGLNYSLHHVNARYLKLHFTCAPKIPKGKPGEGEDAWLFLSELVVE